MSKYERIDLDELGKRLKDEISVESVHETYSGFVNRTGTMSVCPFCGKKKFYQTPGNTFTCYGACKEKSIDIFKYYQMKFNVSFYVAKISLARDYGQINPETAERLLRGKGNSVYIPKKTEVCMKPVQKEVIQKQSPEVISNVYNALSRLSPLKKEQFYYLRNIRKLSANRIVADYFNLPYMKGKAGYEFMDKLLHLIKEKFGYEEKDLIGIPGFYMDENDRMVFCHKKGIGMKARTADKKVNGIQIRNYDSIKSDGDLYIKNPSYKYLWVTSRDLKNGVPAGAAIDVIVPSGPMHTSLIITEGKFKSEIISESFRTPVVSVQGVYQWRGVLEPEIEYIDKYIRKINNIIICFDADIGTNLDVYRELKGMATEVLSKYKANIKMGVWDQRFGKGLDDVVFSNNKDKVKNILYSDYVLQYEIFLSQLQNLYNVVGSDIYYKGTDEKVDKNELTVLYTDYVLKPLGVITAS